RISSTRKRHGPRSLPSNSARAMPASYCASASRSIPNSPPARISSPPTFALARAPIAALLDKALNGAELGFEDGVALGGVAGDDLIALVKTADELRRRKVG